MPQLALPTVQINDLCNKRPPRPLSGRLSITEQSPSTGARMPRRYRSDQAVWMWRNMFLRNSSSRSILKAWPSLRAAARTMPTFRSSRPALIPARMPTLCAGWRAEQRATCRLETRALEIVSTKLAKKNGKPPELNVSPRRQTKEGRSYLLRSCNISDFGIYKGRMIFFCPSILAKAAR